MFDVCVDGGSSLLSVSSLLLFFLCVGGNYGNEGEVLWVHASIYYGGWRRPSVCYNAFSLFRVSTDIRVVPAVLLMK